MRSWQPAPSLLLGLGDLGGHLAASYQEESRPCVQLSDPAIGVALARGAHPDVILVGESLSESSGGSGDPLSVIEELRAAAPDAQILFLAGSYSIDRAAEAIVRGASDVLTPPHSLEGTLVHIAVLRQRMKKAQAGEPLLPGSPYHLDRESRTLRSPDGTISLTGRELELLDRLVLEGGRVVRREQILADIWGENHASEAVLDATVHRLRHKIEADPSNPEILLTVHGTGYRLESGHFQNADLPI